MRLGVIIARTKDRSEQAVIGDVRPLSQVRSEVRAMVESGRVPKQGHNIVEIWTARGRRGKVFRIREGRQPSALPDLPLDKLKKKELQQIAEADGVKGYSSLKVEELRDAIRLNRSALEGDDPALEGDDPALEGDDPTLEGDDPTLEGDDPTLEGGDPPPEGGDPTLEGDDPTMEGSTPPVI